MMRARSLTATALASAVLVLSAGCGSSTPEAASPAASPSSAASSTSTSAATSEATSAAGGATEVTELKSASTSLGTIVTDGNGMTLYMFDKDTKGGPTSACTGECLAAWPPAFMGSAAPMMTGVTGTVASIDTPDGKKQLTLGGWPLYYWAKDTKPGDVTGQAVKDVWWVLDPAGTPIKTKS